MATSRGLFVKQYLPDGETEWAGTTAVEARRALAGLFWEDTPGVPRSGLLDQSVTNVVAGTADTGTMTYSLGPCHPVINRAADEGVYAFSTIGNTTVPTTNAPGADSRWDLIYVKQNDVEKGELDNLAVLGVIQGSVSSSPTKPYASVPAGGLVLAEALVSAGATSTNHANVTISQVWKYTTTRGGILRVRTLTERGGFTAHKGQSVYRLDLGSVETYDGTRWTLGGVQHAEFFNPDFGAVPANSLWGPGDMDAFLDGARSLNPGFASWPVPDAFTVVDQGVYAVTLHIEWKTSVVAGTTFLAFRNEAGTETYHTLNSPAGSGGSTLAAPNMFLAAGERVGVKFQHGSAGTQMLEIRFKITRIR
jgi:hypothetical protein